MALSKLIGLFGGTFDPIHNGHLHIADVATKQAGFDQLRIIPCNQPPHREMPIASAEQRLEMLQLAVEGRPGFEVDTCELESNQPSYAFSTLSYLRDRDKEASFCWLMGLDAFQGFTQWFCWQEILELTHLLVVQRPGYQIEESQESQALLEQHQVFDSNALRQAPVGGILVLELEALDISATDIRQRLGAGKNIDGLVPRAVADMLQHNPIYLN